MYAVFKHGVSVFLNHVGQRVSTSVRVFKLLFDNNVCTQLCLIVASITMSMTRSLINFVCRSASHNSVCVIVILFVTR